MQTFTLEEGIKIVYWDKRATIFNWSPYDIVVTVMHNDWDSSPIHVISWRSTEFAWGKDAYDINVSYMKPINHTISIGEPPKYQE